MDSRTPIIAIAFLPSVFHRRAEIAMLMMGCFAEWVKSVFLSGQILKA